MKPIDPKVVEYLNKALTLELTAINQYFLHARMYKNWGLMRLGAKLYKESIEEMNHADVLIERILFLDGLPNLQQLDKLHIGETVKECLQGDLKLEHKAHPLYQEAAAYCEEVKDFVSREIFVRILEDEEEHIDWLDTQLELIERIGIENYCQSMMGDGDSDDG